MTGLRPTPFDRARVLAFVLLALAMGSCRTGERMLRISPLAGASSRDRVNLWPLVYHDGNATSVLWPIFDVDGKGFALRPLVAKDGTHWSVLFPLAVWDTEPAEGWAFPFYDFEHAVGIFPLLNLGTLSWFGPIWWKRGGTHKVEWSGLFPIATFGGFCYAGPFWWVPDSRNPRRAGLFPVAMFGNFNYVGPAWWTADGDAYGLFPLFGTGRLRYAGPVWWTAESEGKQRGGLFPLLWFDTDGSVFQLLPLYGHDLSEEESTRWALAGLFYRHRTKDRERSWAFPLWYRSSRPRAEDEGLLPFYWKHTRGGRSHVFTLLGDRAVDPASRSFNLYPLWWSNETDEGAWRMLLPCFYFERDGDDLTLLTPLGGRGWTRSGETRYVNVLGPLYHRSESLDGQEERTAFLWPLFERHRVGDVTTVRVLPFVSTTETPEGRESWYALGLGQRSEGPEGSGFRIWPVYANYEGEESPDALYDFTLYGANENAGTTRRHLFPLFWSKADAKSLDASFLLGLGKYESAPGEHAWRLWPLASRSVGVRTPDPLYAATLWGSASWEGGRSSHLLGPLLWWHTVDDRHELERETTRLLLLFAHSSERDRGLHLPRGSKVEPANRIRSESNGFLFDLFVDRDETYRVWREGLFTDEEARTLHRFSSRYDEVEELERDEAEARRILEAHDAAPEGTDADSLRRALEGLAEADSVTVERSKTRLPLIFDHERDGERVEWSGPLWLVQSRKQPGEKSFNFLYYGYRSETHGTATTRDIFPFITWDTDEDESEVSFLWRLFHYHRKGKHSGGHVLFIPWGDP